MSKFNFNFDDDSSDYLDGISDTVIILGVDEALEGDM